MARLMVPVAKPTPRETFETLCKEFDMLPAVAELLLAAGIQGLEEFRFFFVKEEDIAGFLARNEDLATKPIQAARCRRAWHAVRQHALAREGARARQVTAELDDLLDESELRDLKLAFWRRYKTRYPADRTPAGSMLSRLSREMSRRLLMVYNVSLARTLEHQVPTARRRRKAGEGLYTFDDEETAARPQHYVTDAELYLDNLHLNLLALALAGVGKNPQAVDPSTETVLGADSTQHVLVPLDVVMAYWWRAHAAAHRIPAPQRLAWLESRDCAERAVWVTEFRDSDRSLGLVIRDTMQRRDAHWMAPAEVGPRPRSVEENPPSRQEVLLKPANTTARGSGAKADFGGLEVQTMFGKPVSLKMKDGQGLCPAFQHDQCTRKDCPRGVHRCGVVTKPGRVCGSTSHGARKCTAKHWNQ